MSPFPTKLTALLVASNLILLGFLITISYKEEKVIYRDIYNQTDHPPTSYNNNNNNYNNNNNDNKFTLADCPTLANCPTLPPNTITITPTSNPSDSLPSSPPLTPITACDIVFLIFTTPKYHKTRLNDIKNTYWNQGCLSDPRHNFVVTTSVEDPEASIPVYKVPCADGYDASMGCKVLEGWRVARRDYPHAKWFIQGDDDSYFVIPNIVKFLNNFNYSEPVFTGHSLHVTIWPDGSITNGGKDGVANVPNNEVINYAVGWFGAWTKPAMDKIFDARLDYVFNALIKNFFYPDIVVGICMRFVGVPMNPSLFGYDDGKHEAPMSSFHTPHHKEKLLATHGNHDTSQFNAFYQYQTAP